MLVIDFSSSECQPPLSSKDFDPNFSVGFNLGTSYGYVIFYYRIMITQELNRFIRTVAIRYKNGTFENIAKVIASTEYIDMMKRLSLPESKHVA